MGSRYGSAASGVRNELMMMRDHGLFSTATRERRLYFTPTNSGLWDAFRTVIDAIKSETWSSESRRGTSGSS